MCDLSFSNVSYSAFCWAGFVNRYCLNLDLLQNFLFSPSVIIEGFADGLAFMVLESAAPLTRPFWLLESLQF